MAKKENITKSFDELKKDLNSAIINLNNQVRAGASKNAIDKLVEDVKKITSDMNSVSELETFARMRVASNPMVEAIKTRRYITCSVKEVKTEAGTMIYEASEGSKMIDLVRLQNFIGTPIGAKAGWQYLADDFAMMLAARLAQKVDGAKAKAEVYSTFKTNKNTARTQEADPTSKKQLTKRLQECVDAMYFEPYVDENGKEDPTKNRIKVTSQDIGYVTICSGGKGKTDLAVVALRKQGMKASIPLIEDVLYHHGINETGEEIPYKVEYAQAKAK